MKIQMIQTVEDSHGYQEEDPDTGAISIAYDVRKFFQGQEYDDASGGPDFAKRAGFLVRLGYAAEVVE